jgi:hypothetical protein
MKVKVRFKTGDHEADERRWRRWKRDTPGLIVADQGSLNAVVQLFCVPHRPIFFEELENFLQNHLGVGGIPGVRQLETVTGESRCSVLEVQDFLRCKDPI